MVVYSCIGSVTWILSSCEAKLKNGDFARVTCWRQCCHCCSPLLPVARSFLPISHFFFSLFLSFFFLFPNLDDWPTDENRVRRSDWGGGEGEKKERPIPPLPDLSYTFSTIIFDLPYSLQSIEDASGSVAQWQTGNKKGQTDRRETTHKWN